MKRTLVYYMFRYILLSYKIYIEYATSLQGITDKLAYYRLFNNTNVTFFELKSVYLFYSS